MKKIFFICLLIHQSLCSQLEKVYNYNFGDNIKNITSKEYSIYIQKEDGIFNIMNQSIFDSKKIKSLCVSPLGNEVLIVEEKRIGLFKYVKNKVGVESIMNFNKQQTPEILYGEKVNKDFLIFN